MLPSHFLYRKGVVHEENRSYVCMTCVNEQPNKTSHKISIYSASKPCYRKVQKWIWGKADLEESICQIFHMFKHLIMFSPYIWSIMTVTSMFIDMLFSSTLNTKDFLAPAHDLGGPKIQQSCSSRFNRVVHRYKKHASMLFMFTNTTQTLNLGKRNAGNILQHIHTLFISSTGCIKKWYIAISA